MFSYLHIMHEEILIKNEDTKFLRQRNLVTITISFKAVYVAYIPEFVHFVINA